jgi:hypothetical protein
MRRADCKHVHRFREVRGASAVIFPQKTTTLDDSLLLEVIKHVLGVRQAHQESAAVKVSSLAQQIRRHVWGAG